MLNWKLTPQFWSLIIATLLTVVISLLLYFLVIRQQKKGAAPHGLMVILENYVLGFNRLMDSLTGGRLRPAYAYFFTLMNFIIINSLLEWIGYVATPTSFMFTFTLGFITFLGIYIIGIGTNGLIGFIRHKYANPLELFAQFGPLLSISIRLFGATFAGAVIGDILFIVVQGIVDPTISGGVTFLEVWPAISGLWDWLWRLIDTGLSLIQAFVFAVLTAVYWNMDYGSGWSPITRFKTNRIKRKTHRIAKKEQKILLRAKRKDLKILKNKLKNDKKAKTN